MRKLLNPWLKVLLFAAIALPAPAWAEQSSWTPDDLERLGEMGQSRRPKGGPVFGMAEVVGLEATPVPTEPARQVETDGLCISKKEALGSLDSSMKLTGQVKDIRMYSTGMPGVQLIVGGSLANVKAIGYLIFPFEGRNSERGRKLGADLLADIARIDNNTAFDIVDRMTTEVLGRYRQDPSQVVQKTYDRNGYRVTMGALSSDGPKWTIIIGRDPNSTPARCR